MDILQKIVEQTKERIAEQKLNFPLAEVMAGGEGAEREPFAFEKAIKNSPDIAFICEVKRASPSKGIIAQDFSYLQIAREYEAAGAAAISVLTEPFFFKGDDRYLKEIARNVKTPLLRKDFTVDSYMIYEAKALGASAVLLICSVLDKSELAEYLGIAQELGLSALVEAHNEQETQDAIDVGAKIIGVNNRNLKTFEVDLNVSARLREMVPSEVLFVSESGISTPQDIEKLREMGADAALIGESFMKSSDKAAEIARLRGRE